MAPDSRKRRCLCGLNVLISLVLVGNSSAEDNGVEFFEKQVRPILRRECLACHNVEKASGSLALDSRSGWQKGGDSGAVIVPGQPEKSLLIRAVRHSAPGLEMPAKAPKLTDDIIATLETWIKLGAPDPRDSPERQTVGTTQAWDEVARERATWWCWQPLKAGDAVANATIDDWIDRGIASTGIGPSPAADRRTLIRRLSFQLCGLPPTPTEVNSFINDASGHAWDDCVDRFLAKPDFGIHWARHWLDVVRYAETHGSEDDAVLPFSYRYRDYVIRAMQNDVPFDQLIREHLAGDLIPPRWNRELGINEAAIGTAFLRFVEFNQTPVDVKREEIFVIDNQIDAIGKAFQALTISCARCHDHKFDPISDEDYYALYGILRSTRACMCVIDDPAVFERHRDTLAGLQKQIRDHIAPAWIAKIDQWPAALEQAALWCRQNCKPDSKWNDVKPLVPADHWTQALARGLCKPEGNPVGPFGRPSLRALAKILAADDSSFQTVSETLRRELTDQREKSQSRLSGAELMFDLTSNDLRGWQIVGGGLPSDSLVQPGAWSIEGSHDLQFTGLLESGYHTNRISDRHGGSLRSPDFILDMDEISVLARGTGNARMRLVIENFQGDSLLFESVNPPLNSTNLSWVTMHIRPNWRGLRAHLELLTRDDKTYIGVTKEPKLLEQSDGRSSFGVARVVKHPRGARPIDSVQLPDELVDNNTLSNRDRSQWIEAICLSSRHALERFQHGVPTNNDVRWITALLEAKVLRCELPEIADVTQVLADYRRLENEIPVARRSPGVHEDHCAVNQQWLTRGDHRQGKSDVPRRYLAILGSSSESYAGTDSGRQRLADEIASPKNPLTARVYVNRVWHSLFGRGIVSSMDNFGRMGEPPTHPELLDHLAARFLQSGWSTKLLIREILLSKAWQRASMPTESAIRIDPANLWWSHASVRRLEAESIRDTMLFVSGTMRRDDSGLGTQGFYRSIQEPNKQPPPGPLDGDSRRSIFLEVRRNFPNEFLLAFDFPRPAAPVGRRPIAVVPGQSLTLMNDPFVMLESKLWAGRVCAQESDRSQRIRRFYQDLLNRDPTDEETQLSNSLVNAISTRGVGFQPVIPPENESKAWQMLAHAMFNLKEAIYVP